MGELWLVELHWGIALSSALVLIQLLDWMHYPKLYWVTPGGFKVRVGTKGRQRYKRPSLTWKWPHGGRFDQINVFQQTDRKCDTVEI